MCLGSLLARNATLSLDGFHRYLLTRQWGRADARRVLFVMLNPSTADDHVDDPTIRRCLGFARRDGAGHLEVVNLFALRATDPTALMTAADPVGRYNDSFICAAAARADRIVCAWGAWPAAKPRARAVLELLAGARPWTLGLTADGSPRHPLYVRNNVAFQPWGAHVPSAA